MYSRDEIKALTDKVLEIAMSRTGSPDAKIDAAEVSFEGGERAGTRWANSTITTNLVQYDQQISIAVRMGAKQGNSSTRELDEESLKSAVDEAVADAQKAREGSYIEQETWETSPSFNVSARTGDIVKSRSFIGVPRTGGWEVAEEAAMLESDAITTDFWANLDAIGGPESWKMFGTGGDAKGQPTQTNSISHGSPTIRIKKIMVGAAYA